MLNDQQIGLLIAKYERELNRFVNLADIVQLNLQEGLRRSGIRAVVSARAKSSDSLRGKLEKNHTEWSYEQLEHEFTPTILDLAGARVMLYEYQKDVKQTIELIRELFLLSPEPRHNKTFPNPGAETTDPPALPSRTSHDFIAPRTNSRPPPKLARCFV